MPPKKKKVFEQGDDDEDGDLDLSREGTNIVVAIRVDINALREEFVALLRDRDREIEGLNAKVSELHKRIDVLDAKLYDAEAHGVICSCSRVRVYLQLPPVRTAPTFYAI